MTALQARFSGVIRRLGEGFTVAGVSRVGIFSVLSAERAGDYLSSTELDAAARPLHAAYVPHDDATAVSDVVLWDGLTLAVKRVVKLRFQGSTVAKLLVLS